jgi:hypothetical protein
MGKNSFWKEFFTMAKQGINPGPPDEAERPPPPPSQRPRSQKEIKKISFDFTINAFEQIEDLRKKTKSTTKAEVLRNALRLYEIWIDRTNDDYETLFKKDDDLIKVEFLF